MRVRDFAFLFLITACSKPAEKPPEAVSAVESAAATAVAPAAFSLADAAGKWTYVAKSATGDTVLVTAELNATADPAGWTITLPGRPAQPLALTISGDSVMTAVGPYESVLRKGVQVKTDGVLRMSGGKMVGTSTAHYSVKGADSVRSLIVEATRKP